MDLVRPASPGDFDRINEIYNWTIVDNHVSFDLEPWNIETRAEWWESRDPALDCLVAEIDGYVVGVAYSSWYRPKLAYRSSVETTIVLDTDYVERGIGSELLAELLARLRQRGFRRAIAIVALPNDASVRFHQKLGYRPAGTLSEVGYKLGRYWDTMLLEAHL